MLEARSLSAGYGRAQILFGLHLEVDRGEVVALLGRNGAGKSTTLKALMGLIETRSGEVRFEGTRIDRRPPHEIARLGLGYVPEERRIFTDLTVAENLEVGRRAARGARAPWSLARLYAIFPNLAEMQARRASEMSGGEQQMLTIARTLMGNPDAVLLDEPSEGLAPVIVELMAEAVLAMKREGLAVLLSEQNLAFAAAVADTAYLIERGEIRYSGPMAAVAVDEALRDAFAV